MLESTGADSINMASSKGILEDGLSNSEQFLDIDSLTKLAALAASVTSDCRCLLHDLSSWSTWPISYREQDFLQIGTLARLSSEEAILEEYHPAGTNYWSSTAPVAPRFYPYNQCTLWQCRCCSRIYLRHNDDGAYHVALRIRRLHAQFIVDAPHFNDGRESR